MSAIERLLERLETGWSPKADEIDPDIKQVDLRSWETSENVLDGRLRNYLSGFNGDDTTTAIASGPVILWDHPNVNWALTTDGFYWLAGP
jgi:hypothetical protein